MVIKNFIMMNASDKGPVYEITCIDSLSQLYRVLKVQHNNGRKVIQYSTENRLLEPFGLTCQRSLKN